ncbi:MAG: phosphoenolpyruvate synthase [Dehalococcoidia bacterium DG_22]|nr:MAG: phosphoenolpyruvate synthase [Dehalococcoidia bacterium DG_22]
MSASERQVLWFTEVGRQDTPLVGGKGANLGEMTQAQIPVPAGFIVSAHTYTRFLEQSGLRPTIQKLLSPLDYNDSAGLQKVSEEIKSLIRSAPVPEQIAAEIRKAYRQLGGGPVAVRSSATAEDLSEASFAGQQATFLNVVGEDEVVEAVRACWASLFEARAIFYRADKGFEHMEVAIAVPVQRMVQSRRSGVMFTLEPVTGDRSKIAIEALFGLGEAVVSGELTPDLYVLDKADLRILEKQVVNQERQLVRNPQAGAADEINIWLAVPGELRQQQKLSDEQIVALAAIGKRVEEHYGFPQDIEWAEEEGTLHILQTRPVTALAVAEVEAEEVEETAPVLLSGSPASPGAAAGPVKIVLSSSEIDRVEKGDVLVAEMTTPDFVPAMKRAVAIVTDRGGRTAHAAIVSRELGIPCVVGAGEATTSLRDDQLVTVDGGQGKVYEGRAETRLAWAVQEKARQAAMGAVETRTKLYVNLAEPELADVVAARNVDGVGLLRAEFMIAQIGEHPQLAIDEGRSEEYIDKLTDSLRKFAKAFHPRPVVYRTNDFKTNEYRNLRGGEKYEEFEENPMIGYRGASRYIRDIDIFRLELEAIKRVRQDYKNLWVMIPFVRTPEELAGVKEVMVREGLAPSQDFKLWMMAEVPSNALILDKFLDVGIDGISIGSNDLTQLVLGIDRDNARFAAEFDERNEAVTLALEQLIRAASRRGVTSSICGQAPSDYPDLTQKLVEWGITSISVTPDVIDKTRQIIAEAEAKLAEVAKA